MMPKRFFVSRMRGQELAHAQMNELIRSRMRSNSIFGGESRLNLVSNSNVREASRWKTHIDAIYSGGIVYDPNRRMEE